LIFLARLEDAGATVRIGRRCQILECPLLNVKIPMFLRMNQVSGKYLRVKMMLHPPLRKEKQLGDLENH
jgi:hypothetical protein